MHLYEHRGGWRVIVQWGGKRRSAIGPTRMAAMRRGADLIMEMGGSADLSDITVGELVADYLNDLARRGSPKYLDEAERAGNRIPEAFQERKATSVSGLHLDAMYRQLGETLPTSAIRRVHTVIMAAYGRAVKLGALTSAPRVGKPVEVTPDVRPPSSDQAKQVLAQVTGLELLALRLSAVTGCRRGEVVAIQWGDIDLERSRLHVRRSLVIARKVVHERATKTGRKGHRVITLDLPTMTMLRKHHVGQRAVAMAGHFAPPVWVISDDGQEPWRPDQLTAVFIEAREAAGVTGVRLHDLRHYVATTMLSDGEALSTVAQRLGHASVTTTANVYAHWVEGADAAAADKLASRLA